jgi:hypothetical protein
LINKKRPSIAWRPDFNSLDFMKLELGFRQIKNSPKLISEKKESHKIEILITFFQKTLN